MEIKDLQPQAVFSIFDEITRIPRPSKKEEKIRAYLLDFAREHDIAAKTDAVGNVVLSVPATPGHEDAPTVILQGHMDMVAVKKTGASIDMAKEGLRLLVDGDDLYAEDTSLGGDDGIAVAYALAILDSDDIAHPRLEVIITVDEEVGMDGARGLDVSMLKGKRMLNLDSEEEGIILAGCAGGARVDWILPVNRKEKEGKRYALKVKGLLGGHSGAEIDKERGNANVLLGRLLYRLGKELNFYLEGLNGGLADNAIPREACAVIVAEPDRKGYLEHTVEKVGEELKQELQTKDPEVLVVVEELEGKTSKCLSEEDTKRLVSLLLLLLMECRR